MTRPDLPGFLGGNQSTTREDVSIWSCCFPYRRLASDGDGDDPFRTPPSGLNIKEEQYLSGSPRRRKDPTFNVLCQVREALIENYCLTDSIFDPLYSKRTTKPLFEFFGLETPEVRKVTGPRGTSRRGQKTSSLPV